jgi:hypothetical protein|nr:MAG TPA: hypothetical protein [Caudoviricetes sp.]
MKKQTDTPLRAFEVAVDRLLMEFCEKHDLTYEFSVGNDSVDMFLISDYFFSLSDIYFDLKSNQPQCKIIEWYDYLLENEVNINYYSYCMGLRKEQLSKKQND